MTYTKCKKCGWVHFTISRKDAQKYVDAADGKLQMSSFEKCFRCPGDYKDFVLASPGDCPAGSTIHPILNCFE